MLRIRPSKLCVVPCEEARAARGCSACCPPDTLDAQEQRIYQLQTKQRERQAELEQKCSRIQQLSQDLEASHQLQEEAQKQQPRTALLVSVRRGHRYRGAAQSTLPASSDPQLRGFRSKSGVLQLINIQRVSRKGSRSLTFCTCSQENFAMLPLKSITWLTKEASEEHSTGLEDIKRQQMQYLLPWQSIPLHPSYRLFCLRLLLCQRG
ncbi:uncharacterized protein [Ciconia boyciana]|uniref:uncharacterized protein n=1 Tax=Ciconia boyciana TaxID=52775 RepID=UPI003BA2DDE0